MTTPEERDYIGEVIREDVALRCQPMLTLAESLRQYRHKNAEGFVAAYEYDGTRKAFNELRQQLADVSNERDGLRVALSGMLFEFDDGVGEDWSSDLLDYARTLCDAVEFKPSAEVKS